MRKRLLIAAAFVVASSPVALAHDEATWIMDNPATSWCCGPEDCQKLTQDDVSITPRGYLVHTTGETIPFWEAKRSIDSQYWRCRRPDGGTRCLFSPDLGS